MFDRNNQKLIFEPFDDLGDMLTLQEFKDACARGSFIDYDGYGEMARFSKIPSILLEVSNQVIYPSYVVNPRWKAPAWCTHVCWYNR